MIIILYVFNLSSNCMFLITSNNNNYKCKLKTILVYLSAKDIKQMLIRQVDPPICCIITFFFLVLSAILYEINECKKINQSMCAYKNWWNRCCGICEKIIFYVSNLWWWIKLFFFLLPRILYNSIRKNVTCLILVVSVNVYLTLMLS